MGEKAKVVTDLTQTERDHVDRSHGRPWTGTGEKAGSVSFHVESELVIPAAVALGGAAFLFFVLGIPAVMSVLLSTVVVIALSYPQLAPKLLKQVNQTTKKINGK